MIEIKPRKQILKPEPAAKKTVIEEWIINQLKWESALKYAKENGFKFLVLDEYALGITNNTGIKLQCLKESENQS